jgi:hypothetical protein
MTSKRKTIKAGKHERIRKLLTNIHAEQSMLDDNLRQGHRVVTLTDADAVAPTIATAGHPVAESARP